MRVFESARGAVPAVRLPAAVAVLVGARARGAERAGARRRALHAGRDRLPEQLLRPAGASSSWTAGAAARLVVDAQDPSRRRAGEEPPAAPLPPNEPMSCARCSALDLYDQALDELRYAQKVWGDSPAIQATIGWIYNQRGDLRAGINAMKRAYPQYLAAGGEKLPPEC